MRQLWEQWAIEKMEWIAQSGWMGYGGFIVLYTLSCVFFLPGSFLTLGAGAIYGFVEGTLLVSLSSMAGAVVNFLTSRYCLRGWMQKKWAHHPRFQALDQAIELEGWRIVLLSRLSPILPHSVVSYAAGLTGISLGSYSWASWIGFVPMSALYVYCGAFIGHLTRIRWGSPSSVITWWGYGIGLVVTIGVTVWSIRIADRALKKVLKGCGGVPE